jgi:hypothetical protein
MRQAESELARSIASQKADLDEQIRLAEAARIARAEYTDSLDAMALSVSELTNTIFASRYRVPMK